MSSTVTIWQNFCQKAQICPWKKICSRENGWQNFYENGNTNFFIKIVVLVQIFSLNMTNQEDVMVV